VALTPKVGATYRLVEDLGSGVGLLPAGTAVVIESIHKQDVAGVGGDVVVEIPSTPVVVDGEEITPVRRVAFALDDFKSRFKAAGEK